MNKRWAARFPRSAANAALPLRLQPGIEACADGDDLWLLGGAPTDDIDRLLHRVSDVVRYEVESDRTITRVGRRIPEGDLPLGPWAPFSSLAQFQPQSAAMPARVGNRLSLHLIRENNEHQAGAMIARIEDWARYAVNAPQIRLNPLRFALCADSRTLILGTPLPPLPGRYLSNHLGLLVPSGYVWEPRIEPQILRRMINLAADDLALFDLDGTYEMIRAESAIPASRGAARRSFASHSAAGAT